MLKAKLTGEEKWSQVRSVKELAKRPLTAIPDRYLHPQQDPPSLFNPSSSSLPHQIPVILHPQQDPPSLFNPSSSSLPHQIPVIDLQSFVSADSMASELHKLHSACKNWGFFQVINHGVSSELLEKVKVEIRELFELPMEEKRKYRQKAGETEGFGQLFVLSEDQKLEWADLFNFVILPNHLRKPDLFPNLPPSFRETMEQYSAEVKSLTMTLLRLMAKALKIEEAKLEELFGEGIQTMRMNYYPPCSQPEQVIGLKPHSDASGVTVLLHLNEVEGLQIMKDGIWLLVKPIPNAFTINIGDIMEIISNGTYRSIEHRAVINAKKERLSVATFHGPNMDGEFGPSATLIAPQTPALFRRVINVQEYYRRFFTNKLDQKSNLSHWRINHTPGDGGNRDVNGQNN